MTKTPAKLNANELIETTIAETTAERHVEDFKHLQALAKHDQEKYGAKFPAVMKAFNAARRNGILDVLDALEARPGSKFKYNIWGTNSGIQINLLGLRLPPTSVDQADQIDVNAKGEASVVINHGEYNAEKVNGDNTKVLKAVIKSAISRNALN